MFGRAGLNAGQLREAVVDLRGHQAGLAIVTVMMLAVGTFQIIEALTALSRHTYYTVNNDGLVLRVDCTEWGWIHYSDLSMCRY